MTQTHDKQIVNTVIMSFFKAEKCQIDIFFNKIPVIILKDFLKMQLHLYHLPFWHLICSYPNRLFELLFNLNFYSYE